MMRFGVGPGLRGVEVDVPRHVRETSRAAFDLHDRSVPVADLVYDSVFDMIGFRLPRRLVFECRDRRERIRVDVAPDTSWVDVRLAPARVADVTVLQPGQRAPTRTDGRGRARLSSLRPGLLSVLVSAEAEGGGSVRTAWVRT